MLNSFNGPSFQLSCLRFINTFVRTATSAKQQVQIQCELEEAGFDIPLLKMINNKVQLFHFYKELVLFHLIIEWSIKQSVEGGTGDMEFAIY